MSDAAREKCLGNDPTCPCQDGDQCHYRGLNAMTPATELAKAHECAIEVLKNCAAHYAKPEWFRAQIGNPFGIKEQEFIDRAITNATKIIAAYAAGRPVPEGLHSNVGGSEGSNFAEAIEPFAPSVNWPRRRRSPMADNKNISVEEQEKRVFAHQQRITELEGQLVAMQEALETIRMVASGDYTIAVNSTQTLEWIVPYCQKSLSDSAPFVAAYKAKVSAKALRDLEKCDFLKHDYTIRQHILDHAAELESRSQAEAQPSKEQK